MPLTTQAIEHWQTSSPTLLVAKTAAYQAIKAVSQWRTNLEDPSRTIPLDWAHIHPYSEMVYDEIYISTHMLFTT